MQSPVQLQFAHTGASEAERAAISKWVATLDGAHPAIITSLDSLDAASKKKMCAGLCHARLDTRLSGKEVMDNSDPVLHPSCSDVYVFIRDAFKSVLRQEEKSTQIKKIQP